jgi:membrane-associated HD superfamily phosphohydrolase
MFFIWTRVKDKSKAATNLVVISIILTLIYAGYTIHLLTVMEPKYYGIIALSSIICGPVLITLVVFLRDKKNNWGKISFIISICVPVLSFLFGLIHDLR